MNKYESVVVEIGFEGTHIKLNIPYQEYEIIRNDLRSSKQGWITIQLDDGVTVDINRTKVQYIRMRPANVRQQKKREGYTLKSICETTGVNYDVLRQKIKRENIELDYGSERRVLLTPLSIKNLNLTSEHLKQIKKQKI